MDWTVSTRPAATILFAVMLAMALLGSASAQTGAPAAIPVPEIAERAEQLGGALRQLDAMLVTAPAVKSIEQEIPQAIEIATAEEEAFERTSLELSALQELADLERDWETRAAKFTTWTSTLTQRATQLEAELDRLTLTREVWERTRSSAIGANAPAAVLGRVHAALAALTESRQHVERRRTQILTLQSRIAEEQLRTSEVVARIEAARGELRTRLLTRDGPALWTVLAAARTGEPITDRVRAALSADVNHFEAFARDRTERIQIHAALLVVLLGMLFAFRGRAARWAEHDEQFGNAALVFERPISSAVVLALLAAFWLYPRAPTVFTEMAGIALLIPTVRLLHGLLQPQLRPWLYWLALFYLVDRVRGVIEAIPSLERVLFFAEVTAAVLLLTYLLRPSRIARLPESAGALRALGVATRVALGILLTSLATNLLGYVRLSALLGDGVLSSAYLAVVLYAAAHVADGVVAVLLRTRPANSLRAIRSHRPLIRRRIHRAVRFGGLIVWAAATLDLFAVQEEIFGALRVVLTATLSVGSLDLSLGDLVAFGVTVWAAFLLSRFVGFLLEEDVYPRIRLGRGVPYAISSTLHYGLLMVGFFLAVAAAGVDFGRITLLVGAFGVGIGFGLQNVVNNFVSGLILLFERPVQVGDTIRVGELFGDVKRIGIRSSTVRTWDGAEVIVPNSQLISDQVVNWTLSDRHRRIDLPVGVAYGTDPEQVLTLLVGVAAENQSVLREPEPKALFIGFGDSSLDFELRAWTDRFENFVQTRSELAVAVNRALLEAGITIPFPQRDLHVKSVEASVRDATT
jgi:small-conductance mechanosensitive channel